ncbi:head GIN domain-containing protein [Pedobacter cryoconitis]|uniref:Putative autotransporter adhesin-like protein n=1 Tax=Pedobacter cryoconitis TaxID=188932 RepID=A0A327SZN3_9SPHI|nr:head GIN domain-containing protein [Pedobacter cryoconitis]RAJ33304.1 putative autotransporter adhesin-like protein [Pedobacter cryoconitis]
MKKINSLLLLLLLTISTHLNAASPIRINKSFGEEERSVGSFRGVATGGPLTVKITMGNKESLRLEGDQEAISELTTEVISGILTIKPKTKWNIWSRKYNSAHITVYITAKKISSLTMSGSGNMEVENAINSSELVTTLSGSGGITATANVKSFTGTISGSGSIKLSGKADNSNLTLSGSGGFKGRDFAVNDLSAQISGSANIYITVNKNIEAVISGSGSIRYSGNAAVKKTVIGSGSIRKE